MIVKIFSASNIDDLQTQIQEWFDFMSDSDSDGNEHLQIVCMTQSEGDGIINITIVAK